MVTNVFHQGRNAMHASTMHMAASAIGHGHYLMAIVFLLLCIMASILIEAVRAASRLSGVIDNNLNHFNHPQNNNMHPPQQALIKRRWG